MLVCITSNDVYMYKIGGQIVSFALLSVFYIYLFTIHYTLNGSIFIELKEGGGINSTEILMS